MKLLQVVPNFSNSVMRPFNQLIIWKEWKTSERLQAREEEQ